MRKHYDFKQNEMLENILFIPNNQRFILKKVCINGDRKEIYKNYKKFI